MNYRIHKFLWIIIAITLAVMPLRGALALPVLTDADAMSHCTQQVQGDMQGSSAEVPDHGCEHDCSGDRCDGACGVHVPVSAGLTGFITVPAGTHGDVTDTEYFHSFAAYTAHPPFRPPILLS